jgi:hypothetical protein
MQLGFCALRTICGLSLLTSQRTDKPAAEMVNPEKSKAGAPSFFWPEHVVVVGIVGSTLLRTFGGAVSASGYYLSRERSKFAASRLLSSKPTIVQLFRASLSQREKIVPFSTRYVRSYGRLRGHCCFAQGYI